MPLEFVETVFSTT